MSKLTSGHLAVIGVVFFVIAGATNMPIIGVVGAGFWLWAFIKWLQTGK